MAHKLTLEQRIERAHVRFMRHPKFSLASGMFVLGKTEVISEEEAFRRGLPMATAGTDGWDTVYCREFCDQFDDKELAWIVMHENFHKMYRHSATWGHLYEKNPIIAGIACDHVVNLVIKEMDPNGELVTFPMRRDKDGNKTTEPMGCYDEKYKGMDAGQIFRTIWREVEEMQQGQGKGGKGGGQGKGKNRGGTPGKDESFDNHMKPGQGNYGDKNEDGEGEGGGRELSREELESMRNKIEEAIRQGVILSTKLRGTGAGGLDRSIAELLEPKIDWRDVLKEFVISACTGKDVSTWKRTNKRYRAMNLTLPSTEAHASGHIICGIDTSGSVSQELLREFLSEQKALCGILNPERYSLLYWDSYVEKAEEYVQGEYQDIGDKTKPRGGGGTDPNAVCEWIRKNVKEKDKINCVVIMTDGYVPGWGNWKELEHIPVLWLIIGNNVTPDHGVSVQVKDIYK